MGTWHRLNVIMTYAVVTELTLRKIQELLGIQKVQGILDPSQMIAVGIPVSAIPIFNSTNIL